MQCFVELAKVGYGQVDLPGGPSRTPFGGPDRFDLQSLDLAQRSRRIRD